MKRRVVVCFPLIVNRILAGFLALLVISSNYRDFTAVRSEEDDKPIEVVSKRDEYSNTYLNPDGTYTINVYTEPIRYRDSGNELIDIDTSIKVLANKEKEALATDYSYKSSSTAVDVFLPEEVDSENPILLTWNKYSVSLSPITSSSSQEAINNKEEELTLVRLEVAIKKAYLR